MIIKRKFFFILLTQFINIIFIVNLIFIAGCSKEAIHIRDLKSKLMSKVRYERKNAAKELEKIGSDKAIKALVSGLKMYSAGADQASDALVSIGVNAVPLLIDALENNDENIRANSAETLGKIGDKRAVPALIEALNHGNNINEPEHARGNVSHLCAIALGKISDKRAVNALCEALFHKSTKESYSTEHIHAARALAEIPKQFLAYGGNLTIVQINFDTSTRKLWQSWVIPGELTCYIQNSKVTKNAKERPLCLWHILEKKI